MSFHLQFEEMPGYLLARFIGAGTVTEALLLLEPIAEQCIHTNNSKILIDFTEARPVGPSFADRYDAGISLQIFARYKLKVAAVLTQEHIDPQKFGEMVARNRGVNTHVFTDVQAAEEWLLN